LKSCVYNFISVTVPSTHSALLPVKSGDERLEAVKDDTSSFCSCMKSSVGYYNYVLNYIRCL